MLHYLLVSVRHWGLLRGARVQWPGATRREKREIILDRASPSPGRYIRFPLMIIRPLLSNKRSPVTIGGRTRARSIVQWTVLMALAETRAHHVPCLQLCETVSPALAPTSVQSSCSLCRVTPKSSQIREHSAFRAQAGKLILSRSLLRIKFYLKSRPHHLRLKSFRERILLFRNKIPFSFPFFFFFFFTRIKWIKYRANALRSVNLWCSTWNQGIRDVISLCKHFQ